MDSEEASPEVSVALALDDRLLTPQEPQERCPSEGVAEEEALGAKETAGTAHPQPVVASVVDAARFRSTRPDAITALTCQLRDAGSRSAKRGEDLAASRLDSKEDPDLATTCAKSCTSRYVHLGITRGASPQEAPGRVRLDKSGVSSL
jgi:hypothetical protein